MICKVPIIGDLSVVEFINILINLVFVFLVYRLHKKDSNPKITFVPQQQNINLINNIEHKYDIDNILNPDFKNTLTESDLEEFIKYEKYIRLYYSSNFLFDQKLENNIDIINNIDYNLEGFPREKDEIQIWFLNIENKSEYPAKNLKIDLALDIKRAEWDIGRDSADVSNERFVYYKTINETIEFDYFPGLHSKEIKLMILEGQFIQADLKIKKAKSKEITYIKKPTKIDTYIHTDYLEGFEDSNHYRRVIGVGL